MLLVPACPYCKSMAKLVLGSDIYPSRPDLARLNFWQCAPCDAYVGCHKAGCGFGDGTRPLGKLANAALRRARNRAHAAFDPFWRASSMTRRNAYSWLAQKLALPVKRTHIAEFDEATCERVIELCNKISRTNEFQTEPWRTSNSSRQTKKGNQMSQAFSIAKSGAS